MDCFIYKNGSDLLESVILISIFALCKNGIVTGFLGKKCCQYFLHILLILADIEIEQCYQICLNPAALIAIFLSLKVSIFRKEEITFFMDNWKRMQKLKWFQVLLKILMKRYNRLEQNISRRNYILGGLFNAFSLYFEAEFSKRIQR